MLHILLAATVSSSSLLLPVILLPVAPVVTAVLMTSSKVSANLIGLNEVFVLGITLN